MSTRTPSPQADPNAQDWETTPPARPSDGADGQPAPPALLATKLFVPPPHPDWVARPRVDERLNAGMRRKLTLLAAPAGFGKSTALSAWRATAAGRRLRLAWVSLDADDNDPVRFWSYVGAALDTLAPGIAQPALALLRVPQPPPIEGVLTVLLNRLSTLDHDAALVLDDYHAIDAPPVHRGLTFLLDHLPPLLHLVIVSRAEPPLPLARLRARGELVELRAADLRFTPDEATAFLTGVHGLPLAAGEVAALAARTEGWIAGLHLAALSLQDRPDPAGFVRAFAGSHRYLVDYLAEEVLDRQPPDLRAFLLQTAVLDRLSGPLCDALTGRRDGQATLERLERANLFTVPLDDERSWYRYHHLFADFLRARLLAAEPDLPPALHARAATWFEHAGITSEAVAHALAAGDPDRAARLVEHAAEPMLLRGEFATLLGWLEALPRDAVRARPRLCLAHACAHFLARSYDTDAVEALLAEAEAALGGDADPAASPTAAPDELVGSSGVLAAMRAAVASVREDAPRTIAFARQALAALPATRPFWRAAALVCLGLGHDAAGEMAAAGRTLAEAAALARTTDNRYLALVATMNLARVRATEGRLHASADVCRQALDLIAEQGGARLPVAAYVHIQLGKLAYERNELDAAARHLADGIAAVRVPAEQLRALVEGYAAYARVKQSHGDAPGAAEMLRRAEQAAQSDNLPWPWAAPLVAALRARLALRQGDLAAAARWAEETDLRPDDEPAYEREVGYLTLARVLIARGEPTAALPLLDRLRRAAEAAARGDSALEALVLQALAHQAAGDLPAALGALARALALAGPEGYVRRFVDEGAPVAALLATALGRRGGGHRDPLPAPLAAYAERLLAAHAAGSAASPATAGATPLPGLALPEPLTAREHEVLALIAAGLSNPEIAARLFITVGTVKTHVNSLFAKLPATSRTQAVARARALGLLPT